MTLTILYDTTEENDYKNCENAGWKLFKEEDGDGTFGKSGLPPMQQVPLVIILWYIAINCCFAYNLNLQITLLGLISINIIIAVMASG